MNLIGKLLPTIIATLTAVVGLYSGQISGYIADHPSVALVLGAIGTIIANFVTSPTKNQ